MNIEILEQWIQIDIINYMIMATIVLGLMKILSELMKGK